MTILLLVALFIGSFAFISLRSKVFALKSQKDEKAERLEQLERENRILFEEKTRLEEQNRLFNEKLLFVNEAKNKLQESFSALSAEALQKNNQSFLDLAKTKLEQFQANAKNDLETKQKAIDELLKPIRESLSRVDGEIQKQEKSRTEVYSSLREQIKILTDVQTRSNETTTKLSHLLRSPTARGRWGEIQLKNVVEMAGMMSYCDFYEQTSVTTEDGRLRPDLVIKLPGERQVVVDAKVPLSAYLKALEATDESTKKELLQTHVKQVREHMTKLSSKSYWQQFDSSPDFVVMFLPGEAFFSAALEYDTELIEKGVTQKIFLASPITLIALLQIISYGWKQEKMAESAREISVMGQELHERLRVFIEHIDKMGKNLSNAVDSYNKASRSLESRVLVSARKFTDLGVIASKEIGELSQIDKEPILIK